MDVGGKKGQLPTQKFLSRSETEAAIQADYRLEVFQV